MKVLFSDLIADPVEAFRACAERNEVEMVFRKLKAYTGGRRLRAVGYRGLRGRVFIQFLAASISCMLRHRVNTAIKNNKALPYDSIPKILKSLGTVRQTVFKENGYFTEIVGKQRRLYEAFTLPVPEIEDGISYEEDTTADYHEQVGETLRDVIDKLDSAGFEL